jgi:dTDP-4-amino-4,6-dideoxygalactose transaminase
VPFADLAAQHAALRPELDAAMQKVILNSAFIRGEEVDRFEQEFARACGVSHCISCANGTDALYIALRAMEIGPGDEVIVPAHTWISTAETVTQAGGTVVFADTLEGQFVLNPDEVARKITPRTKGIMVVHLYGLPAPMEELQKLAEEHGLWIIEDCAQAHLGEYRGRKVGSFGRIATFSFYPGKNLGAMGDAGAIVTQDDKLAEWMMLYARHGGKGDHLIEGINSRLDGLQAAVLRVKLPHLESWTRQRIEAAHRYDQLLKGIPGIRIPDRPGDRRHVYHLYAVLAEKRENLQAFLKARGIETVVNYRRALPFLPAYARLRHRPAEFPVAHRTQATTLSLPLFPEITKEQQKRVADAVREFYRTAATG